jgi:predicted transcriptional regulator
MKQSTDRKLYARTISSAVEYFEGYGTLAVILNVSVDDLRRWAEGRSRPPVDVFLRIIDLTRRSDRTRSLN